MKRCEKCKIDIVGEHRQCPLCQNQLEDDGHIDHDIFPVVESIENRYNLLFKVVTFLTVSLSIIALLFNIYFKAYGWWSLIVIVVLASVWLSIGLAVYKHKSILKYLLYQSLIIILLTVFIDQRFGWHGWSITYVLPSVFTIAMVVMYTLSKVMKLDPGDYMIYLLLDALFGIIPIISIGSDSVISDIPSYICIIVSILSVTGLVVFEGKKMLNELKRRLHV